MKICVNSYPIFSYLLEGDKAGPNINIEVSQDRLERWMKSYYSLLDIQAEMLDELRRQGKNSSVNAIMLLQICHLFKTFLIR